MSAIFKCKITEWFSVNLLFPYNLIFWETEKKLKKAGLYIIKSFRTLMLMCTEGGYPLDSNQWK